MKKSNIYIKAFTLVEMLIVIVIIGILIAALLPRMQSAQGRARDVARKSDLSQIGNGIIAYQTDKGERPGVKPNTTHTGMAVADIEDKLITAGMSSVPRDPNGSNIVSGLSDFTATSGNYAYLVARKSGVNNGGFVLMTRTETEAASNRLFKEGEKKLIDWGNITGGTDLLNVHLCKTLTLNTGANAFKVGNSGGNCVYNNASQLRYILIF